jgi:PEGA domain-containing protein
VVVVRARPYYPVYYSPYYSPYYFGWYSDFGWYPSYGWQPYGQYRPYPPYGWYGGRYEPGTDVRIQVTPRDAEVYLDGYLVGTVDSFDGVLQRLRVPYGEHEVSIYREGHQTIRQKMLFRPGESYRIRETMQPVAAGGAAEPRPTPTEPPDRGGQRPGAPGYGAPPDRGGPRPGYGAPPAGPPPAGPPQGRDNRDTFGTLAIRVQPADAEVLIDGERWERPEGENRLLVELSEGPHRVEIRKDGFRPYATTVRLRRGETVPLNVSLPPSGASAN